MVKPAEDRLKELLSQAKTIAVVGLSPNEDRPSYKVAKYLQGKGYRIIPVNPTVQEILGEQAYPTLIDIPIKVDIVDIFRKSEDVPPIAEQAISIGAKVLWQQEGIDSAAGADISTKAGLVVITDYCIKVAHQKYFDCKIE
jgi:hypothetical protein